MLLGNRGSQSRSANAYVQVGSTLEEYEDEDIPFWWFHSFREFFLCDFTKSSC